MAGTGDEVVVIGPTSPLVSAIVNDRIVGAKGKGVPLTSAQRLQSNRALVAEVLNHCFWASLAHEEGRPIASGVTFTSPDEQGYSEPLCLERPELLTVESLIRLGTVAGTAHRLAIHEADGKPHVWGFLRGEGPPPWVSVWFDRPAVLRVMVEGGFVLGVLDRGEVFTPQGYVMANPWNVRSQLLGLIGVERAGAIEALTYIGNEMSRHGHGGTILLVDEDLDLTQYLNFKYPLGEGSRSLLRRLRQVREQLLHADAPIGAREAIQNEITKTARQVASLTKVDGATVVGFNLTLFGFAARIRSDRADAVLKRRTIYERAFTEVKWSKLGGMRHQSAAYFVAATRTSAAFVSSHDGGLSVLAWKGDTQPGHLEWLCGLEGLVPPG